MINTLAAGCFHNVQFGLGQFKDYPISPFGNSDDYAYSRRANIGPATTPAFPGGGNLTDFLKTLNGGGGADLPEAQLAGLYQTATGAGQAIPGFPSASIPAGLQADWIPPTPPAVPGAPPIPPIFSGPNLKVVIIFTDDQFHRPGDPGTIPYPGPDFASTIAALNAKGIKVIGMQAGQGGSPFYLPQATADLQAVAGGTGAIAPASGVDCLGDGTQVIASGQPLVCKLRLPASAGGTGAATAILNTVRALIKALP